MTHRRLWCQQWQWIDNLSVNWMQSFPRKSKQWSFVYSFLSFPYVLSWFILERENHLTRAIKWLNILIDSSMDGNVNIKNKNSIINENLQIVDRNDASIPEIEEKCQIPVCFYEIPMDCVTNGKIIGTNWNGLLLVIR